MDAVNISDYLSDEEKKQICKEAFAAECNKRVKDDFERILSNIGYEVVQKRVDALFDESLTKMLEKNVVKVISQLSAYSVFKCKDAWHRDESKGWKYLQESLDKNKELINKRVLDAISEIDEDYLRDTVENSIADVIITKLRA